MTLRCGILTVTLRARFRCLSRSQEAPVEVSVSQGCFIRQDGTFSATEQNQAYNKTFFLVFFWQSDYRFFLRGICSTVLQIRTKPFFHMAKSFIKFYCKMQTMSIYDFVRCMFRPINCHNGFKSIFGRFKLMHWTVH